MTTSLFLAAHLVCVCAHPALATAMTARAVGAIQAHADPHACCHRHADAPARATPRPCQHCSHAELGAPDGPKVAAERAGTFAGAALSAVTATRIAVVTVVASALREHAPPSARSATVVLRL